MGRLSVAQGGRQLSAYTGQDSLAGMNPSVIVFTHLGQRVTHQTGYRTRLFLERGVAHVYQPGGPTSTQVTLSDGLTGSLASLTFPDGSLAGASIDQIDVSPDGRFVSYSALRTIAGQLYAGVYVKRFSDQSVTAVRECAYPCVGGGGGATRWSHDGTRLLVTASVQNPDFTYTGYLQPFAVDTTPAGGFVPGPVVDVPGRSIEFGASYVGDDTQVHTCEFAVAPLSFWLVRRPAGALHLASQTAHPHCFGEDRRIANIIAAQR